MGQQLALKRFPDHNVLMYLLKKELCMKKLIKSLLAVCAVFMLFSCKAIDPVIGRWEYTSFNGTPAIDSTDITIDITESAYRFNIDGSIFEGTWEKNEDVDLEEGNSMYTLMYDKSTIGSLIFSSKNGGYLMFVLADMSTYIEFQRAK